MGIGAVLILGAPARAQIESVNFLTLEQTSGPGALLTQGVMTDAFLTVDFDYIRNTLTGDAYFNPRNILHANTGYSFISAYEITIGPVPVLLYDITLTADALLASSGVTRPVAPTVIVGPFTELMVSATVADVDDLGTPITGASLMRQIAGNGSQDIDEILLAPEVVLAAGETYRVSLDVSLDVDIQLLSEEDDPLITHQFGGLTDFAGYQIEISAAEVPEPGTWTILVAGAATLGVWRLRRSVPMNSVGQRKEPVMKILIACLLAIGAVLIPGAPARAQITSFNVLPYEQTLIGLGGLATQGHILYALEPDFESITTFMTLDSIYEEFNTVQGADTGYSLVTAYEITIGPVPVLLYDIGLFTDGLLTTSGGDRTMTEFAVSVKVADVDNLDALLTGASITRQILGDASVDVDGSVLAPEVVLSAGEMYQVSMSVDVNVELLSPIQNMRIINEFGGLSDFRGYIFLIQAEEVPEPGAWTILLAGAATIGVWRLRRRLG
ncbi:MAG: PEP-CTERM sorting domain-containing protein [Pirellulales bacterium]